MDFLKFLIAIASAFCIQLGKAEEMPLAYKQQEVAYITRVAVFCSADDKASSLFKEIAHEVGKQLAVHNFGVITGGSRTGLMKEVVDGYVSTAVSSQHVYGVIPKVWQEYNVHHPAIPDTNLTWVDTLHIRMAQFHELADAIIVLPGGFGTLHELMDFMAHNQFAAHTKRIILVNVAGYWDHLLALFNSMVEARLVPAVHLKSLCIVTSVAECIQKLREEIIPLQIDTARYWEKTEQENHQEAMRKQDLSITLEQLKGEVEKLVAERKWQKFHDAKKLSMAIVIEASELMEHFVWTETDNVDSIFVKKREEINEELADVLINIIALSNRYDIDIAAIVLDKIAKIKAKYPQEKYDGKSKYTELEDNTIVAKK